MADPKRDGYEPPVVENQYANNSEIAEALQSGSFNWATVPTLPETEPIPIGYIAVAPDDLAELRRKAGCWDALQDFIDKKREEIEGDRLSVDAAKRLTKLGK